MGHYYFRPSILFRVASGFVFNFAFLVTCPNAVAEQNADGVRRLVESRLAQLQNLEVEFHVEESMEISKLIPSAKQDPLVRKYNVDFSFLRGLVKLESRSEILPEKGKLGEPLYELTVLSGERLERYHESFVNMPGTGGIYNKPSSNSVGWGWFIDSSLGMRQWLVYSPWIDNDALGKMKVDFPNDNEAVFSIKSDNGRMDEWTYDRRLAYALTRYRVFFPPKNLVNFEIRNDDFRQVGNLMLPFKMTGNGLNGTLGTGTILVGKYSLGSPENNESRYRMIWPAKANVFDARTGIHVNIGDEPRPLSDQDIADAAEQQKAARKAQLQHTQDRLDRILGTTQPSIQPATRPGS